MRLLLDNGIIYKSYLNRVQKNCCFPSRQYKKGKNYLNCIKINPYKVNSGL